MNVRTFPGGGGVGICLEPQIEYLMIGHYSSNHRAVVPLVGRPTMKLGDTIGLNEALGAMLKIFPSCFLT